MSELELLIKELEELRDDIERNLETLDEILTRLREI